MRDLRAGDRIAGCVLHDVLGRGGMGVVWRAHQERLDRWVALKLVVPEMAAAPEFRDRFVQEARLAARLEHPNVVPVYEAGETDQGLFIIMRLIAGPDLRALIHHQGALAPERAVGLVGGLGSALDAAHHVGLVHRDIKPGNVLVDPHRDHAYLTDFGLSKLAGLSSGLTQTRQWVGTVDYAAPEQIQAEAVDGRADTYALGCLLYEAVTGHLPFDRDSDMAKMWAHVHDPPPRPGALVPAAAGLDPVIERALAKAPGDRFPSAGDLARAAAAGLVGEAPARPERTVATGPAAPPAPETAAPTPAAVDRAAETRMAPTAAHAVAPPDGRTPRPAAPPPPPPPEPPPPRRPGWPWAAAAAAALLLLAGAGVAVALSSDLFGDDASPARPGPAETRTTPDTVARTPTAPTTRTGGGSDTRRAARRRLNATFEGDGWKADHPSAWSVAKAEEDNGPFTETKFAAPDGAFVLIDRTPGGAGDPAGKAAEVEAAVVARTPGYRRIAFAPTSVGGHPAFKLTFDSTVDGRTERRTDLFFDVGGDGYAVLGGGRSGSVTPLLLPIARSVRAG
ncbi:MAG TPA: serine/threonine-protein kinase [Solirubrobacteraceae bacterium]|nr:serine/threonine-protein kinase [Solirubrobacteraceae bacterium]